MPSALSWLDYLFCVTSIIARLACVRRTASVHPELWSNSLKRTIALNRLRDSLLSWFGKIFLFLRRERFWLLFSISCMRWSFLLVLSVNDLFGLACCLTKAWRFIWKTRGKSKENTRKNTSKKPSSKAILYLSGIWILFSEKIVINIVEKRNLFSILVQDNFVMSKMS